MDKNNKGTSGNETSSSVESEHLVDVTEVADSAGIGLPAYFTQALWRRCKLVRQEDDFPGRFEILVFEILKPLALMVRFGLVPYEPEPEESRPMVQPGCEDFGEGFVEELAVRSVMRPVKNGVVSLVVMLEEGE